METSSKVQDFANFLSFHSSTNALHSRFAQTRPRRAATTGNTSKSSHAQQCVTGTRAACCSVSPLTRSGKRSRHTGSCQAHDTRASSTARSAARSTQVQQHVQKQVATGTARIRRTMIAEDESKHRHAQLLRDLKSVIMIRLTSKDMQDVLSSGCSSRSRNS